MSHNFGDRWRGARCEEVNRVDFCQRTVDARITCHNGGSNISPAIANVYAEYSKISHPFPSGINTHDAGRARLAEQ